MTPAGLWTAWTGLPALIGPVYPWISALHIAALGLLIGSIVALDLRLLRARPVPGLADWAPWLSGLAALGLTLAILTGLLLFSVQPRHYLTNAAFGWKIGLIGLGLANALQARRSAGWRGVLEGRPATFMLRLQALMSLLCWLAVLVLGRWIAFV